MAKLKSILLVEDERIQQLTIVKVLSEHYQVTVASTCAEARALIMHKEFDLYILDIILDQGMEDGFELCALIRQTQELRFKPAIFLTSRANVESKVVGFSVGADDYIVKPCDPEELRARIDAKLRRAEEELAHQEDLVIGDFHFDLSRQMVSLAGEGDVRELDLTPLEFKLLYFLASQRGTVVSRKQILTEVWGHSIHVMERSVDTYVALIRKKLGPLGRSIRAVYGTGYKFELPKISKKSA